MIKRLLLFAVLLFSFSSISYSQWTASPFGKGIDTLKANSGSHGVAVDPDGKIWIAIYRPSATDSVFVPDSNKYIKPITEIAVYNSDGTPAAFSPIKGVTVGGKFAPFTYGTRGATGITRDKDGNMIYAVNYSLFKVDYKTGAGMARWDAPGQYGLTRAACDTLGNVYISATLGGYPISMLTSDLQFSEVAVDTLKEIGRTLEVSPDGSTIYAPRFTAGITFRYVKAGLFEPFKLKDTIFVGWKTEGIGWNPANKLLYVSAGSYNDKPAPGTAYSATQQDKYITIGTYYGVRPSDLKVIDSVAWKLNDPVPSATSERNRGIAFSNNGKTAYMVEFNNSNSPLLQRYTTTNLPSDVKRENTKVVDNYSLSQNFPNPFNPSTEIKFSIAKDGMVSLKVYDILGKEVTTLVNQEMSKGNYSVTLNASTLTSGIYIYQLNTNGILMSRKMTLLK